MGGIGGVANSKVVVIGAGVAGQNAANIALGMGADVTLLDTDLDKLRMSFWRYDNRVAQIASSAMSTRSRCWCRPRHRHRAHPRRQGPQARHRRHGRRDEAGLGPRGRRHRPGWLLRELARRRTPTPPSRCNESIYYCVANMPGAVPHTSTWALTNATLSYATKLAEQRAGRKPRGPTRPRPGPEHPRGHVTYAAVAEAFDMESITSRRYAS